MRDAKTVSETVCKTDCKKDSKKFSKKDSKESESEEIVSSESEIVSETGIDTDDMSASSADENQEVKKSPFIELLGMEKVDLNDKMANVCLTQNFNIKNDNIDDIFKTVSMRRDLLCYVKQIQ